MKRLLFYIIALAGMAVLFESCAAHYFHCAPMGHNKPGRHHKAVVIVKR